MRYSKKNSIKFPFTNFNVRNRLMFYFFMTFCGVALPAALHFIRALLCRTELKPGTQETAKPFGPAA